jgi:hypothetical protein
MHTNTGRSTGQETVDCMAWKQIRYYQGTAVYCTTMLTKQSSALALFPYIYFEDEFLNSLSKALETWATVYRLIA